MTPPAPLSSHRRVRCVVFLGALVVFLSWVGGAAAQGRSGARELEAIRRRMEAGLALFVGSKFTEAAREFDAGYAEHPYSAFLFNAGVCYQKLGDKKTALDRYHEYLRIDPSAPDAPTVQRRVAALEAELAPAPPTTETPSPAPPPEAIPATEEAMRSLVVVETDPAGAPVKIYAPENDATPAFSPSGPNTGWREAASGAAPASFSLAVGRYHIVVEKFRDFNASETELRVSAGHVYHFKANLSQGTFMSFLRVSSNYEGAHVWLDDPKKERPDWGTTPYGELVSAGDHEVLVEATGFQPLHTNVRLAHGEQKELEVRLVRVDYGIVRVDSDADDAKIQIDSEPRGIWRKGEPPFDVKVSAGRHKLTIEGTDRKPFEGMIDVPRGELVRVHAKLTEKPSRSAAWVETVISAVLIGTGTFLGLESNKLHTQLAADRSAYVLDENDSRVTRGKAYSIAADVAFVAGAGFAALATYSFLEDPMPDSTSKFEPPTEFDDPLKGGTLSRLDGLEAPRIARLRGAPAGRPSAGARRVARARRGVVSVGVVPVSGGGGIGLGGMF